MKFLRVAAAGLAMLMVGGATMLAATPTAAAQAVEYHRPVEVTLPETCAPAGVLTSVGTSMWCEPPAPFVPITSQSDCDIASAAGQLATWWQLGVCVTGAHVAIPLCGPGATFFQGDIVALCLIPLYFAPGYAPTVGTVTSFGGTEATARVADDDGASARRTQNDDSTTTSPLLTLGALMIGAGGLIAMGGIKRKSAL